jgi:hypothetical protein
MALAIALVIAYIPFIWGIWHQKVVDDRNNSVAIRRYDDEIKIDKDDAL